MTDSFQNLEAYQQYPTDIYIQILFIVGRTFYVMGAMETATELYYYAFNLACKKNLQSMSIKALHRICIVEEKLGMFDLAISSLEALMQTQYFISAKRKAFAHYRISKCYLGVGDYEQAHKNNDASIELKQSFNARRGIAFSQKLRAQIFLAQKNIPEALYWSQRAFEFAQEIGIKKEVAATGLTYIETLLANGQVESAIEVMELCIDFSGELFLCHRLRNIVDICRAYALSDLERSAQTQLDNALLFRSKMMNLYNEKMRSHVLTGINIKNLEKLISGEQSLSQRLLILLQL